MRRETWEGTARCGDAPRPLQDEATRAWNLHIALYYKAGGTPWRMPRRDSDLSACYVGVSFYRTADGGELHTAVAQVFNERGDGVVVRGGTATISKTDRRPHLADADARKLLSDALAEYRRTHGHQPARIVLHKTSQFSPAEVAGFQGAADEREIDFPELIWILSRSETRSHAVSWGFAAGSVAWLGSSRGGAVAALPVGEAPVRLLAVLVCSDLSKDVELHVLRHENQVLRRQLIGRLRWGHADRLWLAALSRLVSRRRWAEVFPVTILRWHRNLAARKWDYTSRRRPGRLSTGTSVEALIIGMARKTRLGGHRRIQGELTRLGHAIAASTVWEILHAAGTGPAPRRAGPTWRQFLTAQAHAIIACDFLVVETVLLQRLYVLV